MLYALSRFAMKRLPALVVAAVLLLAACDAGPRKLALAVPGGDPTTGRVLITRYGCDACHTIPGIRTARGMVGPPLAGIAGRTFIAGTLDNTPENMVRWIRDPWAVDSATAMPNLGVTEQQARDIAAYLYTLR